MMQNNLEKGLNAREMDRKGIKNKGKIVLICLMSMVMAACGSPSGEKIAGAQGIYADLVNLHNEVVEAYAGLEDDSLSEEIDALAERIESIGQQDTQGLTNEELDAVVDELNGHREAYEKMLATIQGMESGETEKKIYEVPVTIKNNTNVNIHNLYLYKASDTDKGENLLKDMEYLGGFQTLNILNLYMTEDEMLWHLEATENTGDGDTEKVIESVDIDFTGKIDSGITIIMKFSFDSMEGWVEM